MELKLVCKPLGTWQFLSSNRTFMELKFLFFFQLSSVEVSSNRTFMELKFWLRHRYRVIGYVLIVPLWN